MMITGGEFSFGACYLPAGFSGSAEAVATDVCLMPRVIFDKSRG